MSIDLSKIEGQDIVGDRAIKIAMLEYMRSKAEDRPQREQDDWREWICIAKGWESKR